MLRRAMNKTSAAAAAILGSAAVWATAPTIVHVSAGAANPFLFNVATHVVLCVLLTVMLASTARSWGSGLDVRLRSLISPRPHLCYLRSGSSGAVEVVAASWSEPRRWARLPLVWAAVSSMNVAVLVWSSHLVPTAVAAVCYETWPVPAMWWMRRLDAMIGPQHDPRTRDNTTRTVDVALVLAAVCGLAMTVASQHSRPDDVLAVGFSAATAAGVLLGLTSGALGALTVIASVVYAEVLHRSLPNNRSARSTPFERVGVGDMRSMVWATVLAVAVGRLAGLPLSVLLWQTTPTAQHGLDGVAVIGAATLGIVGAATALLIRVGNVIAEGRSEVNMLFFASPVIAVALLAWVDDGLQNLPMYLLGAGLIIAATTIIQTRAAPRP